MIRLTKENMAQLKEKGWVHWATDVCLMFQKKYYLYFSPADYKVLVNSLVQLKKLIQQGRFTDYVDDLIMKVVSAPVKRI